MKNTIKDENEYPLFQSKRILTSAMLENVRDYPREMARLWYADYGNGILAGLGISAKEGHIRINAGMLRYLEEIYLLREPVLIEIPTRKLPLQIRAVFLPKTVTKDCIHSPLAFMVGENRDFVENELELGRFHLNEGAELRTNYVNFEDYATEYDTVDRIDVLYSCPRGSTIFPDLTMCFGREAILCGLEDPVDAAFGMLCLNESRGIARDVIVRYINVKLQKSEEYYGNRELYHYLSEILGTLKEGETDRGRQKSEKTIWMM